MKHSIVTMTYTNFFRSISAYLIVYALNLSVFFVLTVIQVDLSWVSSWSIFKIQVNFFIVRFKTGDNFMFNFCCNNSSTPCSSGFDNHVI